METCMNHAKEVRTTYVLQLRYFTSMQIVIKANERHL